MNLTPQDTSGNFKINVSRNWMVIVGRDFSTSTSYTAWNLSWIFLNFSKSVCNSGSCMYTFYPPCQSSLFTIHVFSAVIKVRKMTRSITLLLPLENARLVHCGVPPILVRLPCCLILRPLELIMYAEPNVSHEDLCLPWCDKDRW